MSKKNETTILVLALLLTLGLVGGGYLLFGNKLRNLNSPNQEQSSNNKINSSKNKTLEQRISLGEKILIPGEVSPDKKSGVEALAVKKSSEAISNLEAALKLKKNDPETLIFLNNARIRDQKSYTIAVSVPIGTDPNSALEVLRGVAQAQNEINAVGGINGIPLKVAIANDDDNPEIAKQIAETLVNNSEVLGVVGPLASDTTLAAGEVYNSGKLVAISPVSTSVKLTNFSPYVYRTVPSDFIAARALANYMTSKLQGKKAAVFFNSQSNYSQSLKSEFVSAVSLQGGQVTNEFDLSKPDFSAAQSIAQATQQGAQVLMLAANTDTLDKALQVVQVNQKKLPVLGGDDVYSIKTLEIGREAAIDMVIAVPWHIQANNQSDFTQTSRDLWGADVNWRTATAYDATKALITALERNPSRGGVKQALLAPDFSTIGASGKINFLPSGDRNGTVQLVKIVRGERSRTGYDFVPISQ
ncbi:MAG: ABC transporter substrate-binding protein [Nostocaceae cyanobacterium]|nr:ABC transporter substrate-binding protein [Nostocaceae cyanobacterium]